MPLDLKFDPITQDEIDDGHGSPVLTDKADTAVQLAYLVHYQEAWQDSELGSRFHNLDFFQGDPEPLAEQEASRVTERLIAQGRISAQPQPEVRAEFESALGRLKLATTFRDANTGQLVNTFVRSGG